MIFLKEAPASVAQISADGSTSFISFPNAFERASQFGLTAQSDGTIWLAYHPIHHDSLTWNEVYASKYQGGAWSTPILAGYNYNNYNVSGPGRNPGLLIYRTDQPQVAFMTPDQKIHSFSLTDSGQAPASDTVPPTTAISTPGDGSTLSGSLTVSAVASDNVGVDHVDLFVDGVLYLTTTLPPYNFLWNTTKYADGTHVLETRAVDAAGNTGLSAPITVTVRDQSTSTASLSVAITAPSNGSSVPRNQKVTISAVASDTTAVSKMQFFVNNKLLGSVTSVPYNYPWKVPAKRGTYNIKAQAYDAAGNTAYQAINVVAQ
jgi:hypothetical protein